MQPPARASLRSLLLASGVFFSSLASAGGFQVFEQNAAGLGSFHAGGAAVAEDASTAFFNAAGLTHLQKTQVAASAIAVFTYGHFSGQSNRVDTLLNVHALLENGATSTRGAALLPALQIATPLYHDLFFGFDISVPFGLATHWQDDSVVRYQGTDSAIEVLNTSASLAYKINNRWSVGGGADIQFLQGTFDMIGAFDSDGSTDTPGKNDVQGVGYGWHLGVLYDYSASTRIGLHYRSAVKHNADGDSTLRDGPIAMPQRGTANIKVTLPATTTLSFLHALTPQWDIMASAYYTQWSVIDELRMTGVMTYALGLTVVSVPTEYKNTYTLSIGSHYRPCGRWQFSAGLGYDQSPVNDRYRDIRLPDNDRLAVSMGARYQMTKSLRLDVGYVHLFIKDSRLDSTVNAGFQSTTLNGEAQAHADIAGLQLTWNKL